MDRSQDFESETLIGLSVDGKNYEAKLKHHRDGSWVLTSVLMPGGESLSGGAATGTCLAVLTVADQIASEYFSNHGKSH